MAEMETSPKRLINIVAASMSIAAMVIAAFFWVFTVNAKADQAKEEAGQNSRKIEVKADRAEVKENVKQILERLDRIDGKLDKINDYMLRQNERRH